MTSSRVVAQSLSLGPDRTDPTPRQSCSGLAGRSRPWVRLVLLVLIGLAAPLAAQAWTLNTWVRSGGGSMTSPNMTNQTSTTGSLFKSYTTTSGTMDFSATPNPGYQISSVVVNSVTVATNVPSWSATLPITGASQSVWVTFTAVRYSLTATAGTGGSVTPTSVSNLYYGNQVAVTFMPISGWNVQGVTVTGASAVTCNGGPCIGPWAANASVRVVSTVAGDVNVAGTFAGPPVAKSGASQTVPPGAVVTLDGGASLGSPTSYSWAQTGGPTTVSLVPSGALATFVAPSTAGTYDFRLTVEPGGSYALTSVLVTTDPVGAAQTQCNACHAPVGVGVQSGVFANWSAGRHAAGYVMCYSCHVGANAGGHPGDVGVSTVSRTTYAWLYTTRGYAAGTNFCAQCHADAEQFVEDFQRSIHSTAPGAPGTCSGCHGDAHAASGAVSCAGCHSDGAGCISAHTFAGSANTSCWDCHEPHTAGTAPSGGHAIHLSNGLSCSACHAQVCSSSPAPNVVFAGLATAGGAVPAWNPIDRTCSNVYCHGDNTLPIEWTYVDPSAQRPPEVRCAPCHGYPPASPHPQMTGCDLCHSTTVLPDGSIDVAGGKHLNGALDFSPEFSGGAGFDHTASPGSGSVALFPDDGHDDAGWTGQKPYFAVPVDCTLCHHTDLPLVHGGNCGTCHPTPQSTLGTWAKGCQQGGCHESYHDYSFDAHGPFEDAYSETNDCHRCHQADWSVGQSNCLNCHAATASAYTAAPETTASVQPTYIGPAKIDFSITVNGKVGLGRTFYKLDGGATQAAAKSLFVSAVGSHTLEFWSLDQFGSAEADHHTESFTVVGDSAPPATTSNARATYYQGARITLTASDASTLGVKATYYRVNGGDVQTGTDIVIPAANGTIAYTLTFWSEDWSGNVEGAKTATFTVTSGSGTIRLVWGDSDLTGSPCSGDPEAKATWTVWRIDTGAVVATGSGGCPNWSGVDDVAVPPSTAAYAVGIDWWDSWEGYYDQTLFYDVYVTAGQVVQLNY
ncbi:MAG: hypothetical protein HY900_10840 [Deltaproteobacteria bacterium]|nr:hypothetical protein [Deltaproteobacteria bacterium]